MGSGVALAVTSHVAANHSLMRESNMALVAAEIFASGGGLSRANVASRTGLTRATVSRLVKDLIRMGIVVEAAPQDGQGAGRPATPLFPAPNTMVGIGLEVNADRVYGCALDLAGNTIDSFSVDVDLVGSSPAPVMELLEGRLEAMRNRLTAQSIADIIAVNIGVPGIVDTTTNSVIYAPNLGWRNFRPADFLREMFGPTVPIWVENDANLQAISVASPRVRDPNWPRSFFYVAGDVGIGGSMVSNGVPDVGRHGWAGEIGHITIEPNGPSCSCGSAGCLEQYAGRQAILANAGLPASSSVEVVLDRVNAGDLAVTRAVSRAGWALGIAISNVINLLDVTHIILGTSLAPLLPLLRDPIDRELNRRVLGRASGDITVLAAPPETSPTSRGGALLALQGVVSDQGRRAPEV